MQVLEKRSLSGEWETVSEWATEDGALDALEDARWNDDLFDPERYRIVPR